MSYIDSQIRELREIAEMYEGMDGGELLKECADTIESLYKKLNEKSNGGWIPCSERFPETSEYMEFEPTPHMKRIEIAYMTDTVEYLIGFYDGSKWMDKHHNIIKNVIAWKPFLKLPEAYHG